MINNIYDRGTQTEILTILKIFVKYNFVMDEDLDDLVMYSYVLNYQSIFKFIREQNLNKHADISKDDNKLSKTIM